MFGLYSIYLLYITGLCPCKDYHRESQFIDDEHWVHWSLDNNAMIYDFLNKTTFRMNKNQMDIKSMGKTKSSLHGL